MNFFRSLFQNWLTSIRTKSTDTCAWLIQFSWPQMVFITSCVLAQHINHKYIQMVKSLNFQNCSSSAKGESLLYHLEPWGIGSSVELVIQMSFIDLLSFQNNRATNFQQFKWIPNMYWLLTLYQLNILAKWLHNFCFQNIFKRSSKATACS